MIVYTDFHEWEVGKIYTDLISIQRKGSVENYPRQRFLVLREATIEEFFDYCRNEMNLELDPPEKYKGYKFFQISVD